MSQKQTVGSTILIVILVALLVFAVIIAAVVWSGLDAVEMSHHGVIAMSFGIIASLGLGIGLMGLVFYSSRRGYDDGAN